MPHTRDLVHQLAIAGRLATRSLRRRLSGAEPAPVSDEEFRATLDLVRQVRFDDAFTYRYSPRDGTPATRLPTPVAGPVRA